jgi:hypothetical protein
MVRAIRAKPMATTAAGNPLAWMRLVTLIEPVSHARTVPWPDPARQRAAVCSASHKSSKSNGLATSALDNIGKVNDAVPGLFAQFPGRKGEPWRLLFGLVI